MFRWILWVALIAGATSAPQRDVGEAVQPQSIAVLQSFPFLVQLEFYSFWSTIDWSQECAAVVLNSRHCLTAASCLSSWSYEPRFRRLRLGSSSRNTGGSVVYVQDRLNHPNWDDNSHSGDLGIIRTLSSITYSSTIQQASLASPGSWIPHNLRLSQPGWGRAEQPALTNQEVLTANRNECGRRDGSFSPALNATVNILCAIPPTGIASNDDVGSPWVFNGVVVGLLGGVNTVDTYNGLLAAEVGSYTEWIVNGVNQHWQN